MKKILLLTAFALNGAVAFAQVGIGNTAPKSQLDISAGNPASPTIEDGLLIPRIDLFPSDPTIDQNGMMVFLTADLPGKPKGFYYWNNGTTSWIGVGGGAKGWELTGNAGTNATTNFIGTTDNVPLVFKVSGQKAGRIGITDEVFLGYQAGNVNSGTTNTGIGFQSMLANATGNSNTAIGYRSLYQNVGGYWNTALGMHTLYFNDEGIMNTASGTASMLNNKTGSQNSAYGVETLWSNVTGYGNVASGRNAMRYNVDGDQNVAYGRESLFYNVNSDGNTAIGNDALHKNTGEYNTAIGYQSGSLNDTGSHNITVGANANVPVATSSDQLSIGNVIYGTTMSTTALGKIGIGEPAPDAKFQISSATPAAPVNTDGIIIPRVSTLAATASMTAAQNGLMVFLTTVYSGNQPGFYYWDQLSASWKGVLSGDRGWELNGNSNITIANFFGTTTDSDIYFKRYNVASGRIAEKNTAFGNKSMSGTMSGQYNAAFGNNTFTAATSGFNNSAFGDGALKFVSSGGYNSAFGSDALRDNDIGSDNFGMGYFALAANKSASKNTAVGNNALAGQSFANGSVAFDTDNVAIGYQSLFTNNPTAATNGNKNTAIGNLSLRNNTIGSENVGVGYGSLRQNTTGQFNIAIGSQALYKQNFANGGVVYESSNTAIGYGALYGTNSTSSTNGIRNIGIGIWALANNGIGTGNIAIGGSSMGSAQTSGGAMTGNDNLGVGNVTLKSIETGSRNIAMGAWSLNYNRSGDDNIALGTNSMYYATAQSGGIAIGTGTMENYGILAAAGTNDNVAIGYQTLRGISVPALYRQNTAVGYQSMSLIASASANTGFGYRTLYNNKSAAKNTAIGSSALFTQSFANANTEFDSNNVAVGFESLYANNPTAVNNGINNTAIGSASLRSNTIGSNNAALGQEALFNNASGSNNVALGYQAGYSTTGSNNISIGKNADVITANASNQMSIANVIYGQNMNDVVAANLSIGTIPSTKYKLYAYSQQLTANGIAQSGIYAYRTVDISTPGTGYSISTTNRAIGGYNYFGDMYTFGITGHCYNDDTRTGGILGSYYSGAYWGSLGYKNSAGVAYGAYATSALGVAATGAGRAAAGHSQPSQYTIGAGFYGGMIGSWSKGNVIGSASSGSLFASYNSGDEYTAGKQIELVVAGAGKTAAYTVTSTEIVVYKKGKAILQNGSARVAFDANYIGLLGDIPVVTTTPMGQCNGIYIESVDKTGFTIKELNNGASNVSVAWIAVGDRVDAGNRAEPSVLDKDFDANINEVMFNENNKGQSAKGMWTEGSTVRFGQLPKAMIPAGDKKDLK